MPIEVNQINDAGGEASYPVLFFKGNHRPSVSNLTQRNDYWSSMGTIEWCIHFIQTIQKASHLK